MDDLDVHAGSSDEDMVHNVKTRATRKKVLPRVSSMFWPL